MRVALDLRYLCHVEYDDMDTAAKAEAIAWHRSVLAPALDGLAAVPALLRAMARG